MHRIQCIEPVASMSVYGTKWFTLVCIARLTHVIKQRNKAPCNGWTCGAEGLGTPPWSVGPAVIRFIHVETHMDTVVAVSEGELS